MSSNELGEITFDELVKRGVELELDAVVQGKALKGRVYEIMSLAVLWASERKRASTVV